MDNSPIPAEETIRRNYAVLSEQDIDTWLETFTTDAVVHELPNIPDTATYTGHDEIRVWARNALDLLDEWEWKPVEIVDAESDLKLIHVVLTVKGPHSDVPLRQDVFHIVRFEDEKVAYVRGFLDRPSAEAELPR